MTAKKKTETPRPAPEPVKITPSPWVVNPLKSASLALQEAAAAGVFDDNALSACHFLLGFCTSVLLTAGRDCRPGAMVLPFEDGQKNKTEGGCDVSLGND